ncbi:MAG TPA: thioredoxin domain-containing protein [Candidatus Binatia bacterium]
MVACVQTGGNVRADASAPRKPYEILRFDSAVRGPEHAPVTLVEFSDFQCPYCAQATTLVEQVLRAYPRDVNFVYKNFPLPMHQHAADAARAALAAGRQGKFWEMHDELFRHYAALDPETIRGIAGQIGLDMARFRADLASPEVAKQLDTEIRQGKVAGVNGTPSFFINNRAANARSLAGFKAMIDEELKKQAG